MRLWQDTSISRLTAEITTCRKEVKEKELHIQQLHTKVSSATFHANESRIMHFSASSYGRILLKFLHEVGCSLY